MATKKLENLDLPKLIESTNRLISTATKNHNSVRGTNFYANKFLENAAKASHIMSVITSKVSGIVNDSIVTELSQNVDLYFNQESTKRIRRESQRKILSIFRTKIQPRLIGKQLHAPTDSLFPLELVENTKPYIQKIALQACGCYDQHWYDACAVMVRRLLENLIIECFEFKQITKKIKKSDDNFFYLSDLITKFLAEGGKTWNPSRNCKSSLPKLKEIGDKSAHNRYFTARQKDLLDIQSDLRTIIEELVHISELKK